MIPLHPIDWRIHLKICDYVRQVENRILSGVSSGSMKGDAIAQCCIDLTMNQFMEHDFIDLQTTSLK